MSYDDRLYSIDTGNRTRPGIRASDLKQWLLNLGVGDSTIAAVLDMHTNETMTVKVAETAA